ncbi:Na+/H+ antiporter NhaC family protein [Elizabethkingia argentiflava]|uniref:Na+/H+ antiporter NhaC family protein n=1 Tax=Elizabethkingia argenteiflava TaxID=2681556 RepID=A0A845PQE6_9FLAO|nr:Na+/H+ antiporter NhaC family protein [Elizabethkingia argenteiflava]NAW50054.1 Na+/H+ antiporter NhaC family protein [Elizabethkingia argenteiflava]
MTTQNKNSLLSIIPFLIFILVFLGAGVYYGDFYAMPSPIAIIVGIISAFIMLKGSIKDKMSTFMEGCGDRNILTMCIIYILAGAFATVSKAIGSVDAIVNIGINNLSPEYYPAGIFFIASFLSLASGTSVGTVVALGPIAIGLSNAGGCDINVVGAALLGGAMFGDNLSIISDTTIAATQILGCDMRDKFKNNLGFALPAAILAFFIYIYVGAGSREVLPTTASVNLSSAILVVPYLVVILLAFLGLDVFLVLVIGVVLSGLFGFIYHGFSFLEFSKKVYEGFTSMTEIFLLSLFTGGLAAMVEKAGGIESLLNLIKNKIKGPKSALLGIGSFVGITDLATANNTISIIISGKVSKKITEEYNIRPRVTSSILDTFSCIVQGIIPYGAQVLILIGYSKNSIDYPELLKNSFYLILLFIAVLIYIFVGDIKENKSKSAPLNVSKN